MMNRFIVWRPVQNYSKMNALTEYRQTAIISILFHGNHLFD